MGVQTAGMFMRTPQMRARPYSTNANPLPLPLVPNVSAEGWSSVTMVRASVERALAEQVCRMSPEPLARSSAAVLSVAIELCGMPGRQGRLE